MFVGVPVDDTLAKGGHDLATDFLVEGTAAPEDVGVFQVMQTPIIMHKKFSCIISKFTFRVFSSLNTIDKNCTNIFCMSLNDLLCTEVKFYFKCLISFGMNSGQFIVHKIGNEVQSNHFLNHHKDYYSILTILVHQ